MTRTGVIAGLTCAVALCAAPATASAIEWDAAGAIPARSTPPPSAPDPNCEQSYANDARGKGPRLRFGIGPRLAGEGGTGNATPLVPEDFDKRDAKLAELKGDRFLAVRLNRLFMEQGKAGIAEFKALADRFTKQGIEVELQVRYHPAPADDGDIDKWLAYVRDVIRTFGPNKLVTGFQITNEVNFTFSPNTSDGAYRDAETALVRGVIEAKRESRRLGYTHQRIGFNYAWRTALQGVTDPTDAAFWSRIGALGGAKLVKATDWVGIDAYPGTYVPGILMARSPTVVNVGDAFLEGIAQTRECFMPKAGFTMATPLRVEETGYPTGPDRPGEAAQARAVKELVTTANNYRGTYNISDFRFFGLRDNNSEGPNFQSYFGLLRDDYSPKPAFGVYRDLVERYGASAGA